MFTSVAVRHTLRAYFCSSTTLVVPICLHNPQTEVCLLCAGVVLGTTINIVVHCISGPFFFARHDSRHIICLHIPQTEVCLLCTGTLGSLKMTLGIVVHLYRPQIRVYLLRADVPLRYNL